MTNVLAIDPGLANLGAARLHHTGQIETWVRTSPALDAGPDGRVPLIDILDRVWAAAKWAVSFATESTVVAVLEWKAPKVEHEGAADERAAIRLLIARALTSRGVPVAICRPGTMEKILTGHGRPGKDRVRDVVHQLHPGQGLARVTTHQADAAGLATLGQIKLAAEKVPGWSGHWLDARALGIDNAVQWPAIDWATLRTEKVSTAP